ncbi:LADA_0E04038g1_1 [Lachancea dasiensis]|uniref:Protein CASP n=1 Tax=Lachancea dasiensis TaxID=1072105 RepID=A0A1G4JC54_9SACH|nr:LADA_0E04038g1_1 [Lachancea dasiensis]
MDVSVFQHAASLWSEAGLPELQRQLDESVLTVKELEAKSLNSRKLLATETKQFKKLDANDKLSQVNKVIKSYQQEVDSLTSRSKFSEEVLIALYSKLSEAPDPQPLLEFCTQQSGESSDSEKLKRTIDELENKLSKYADYDKVRARVLDLEQNSAKTLAKRISAKEQELRSQFFEKERNWKEREKEFNRQLETYKDTNKILENKLSQHVDGQTSVTEDQRQSAENELLLQEIQSSQSRIVELEKRNEELSGALAKATSEQERESELNTRGLKINGLESENALLCASLERERRSRAEELKEQQNRVKALEQQVTSSQDELDKKARKLNIYADYDAIKQELTALKKIEFGTSDDEKGDVDSTLLNANKKLQSNLAELRGKFNGMDREISRVQGENKKLVAQVKHLEDSNAKLELDLEKIENVSSINDTASMMSGVTRQMNRVGNSTRPGGKLSPTSSIVGIPEEAESFQLSNGNSTILPIVMQQRDRLRVKITELEKKLRQTNLNQGSSRTELERLKNDNSKLYERIRYLSSYVSKGDHTDDQSPYSRSYNESLHPLAEFKQQELNNFQKKGVSPLEKLFLSFAKIILANKTSRMFFMLYCLGLHVLMLVICIYVASLSGGEVTIDSGVRI